MGAGAGPAQVQALAFDAFGGEGPFQGRHVALDAAAKATGRAQQEHPAGSCPVFPPTSPAMHSRPSAPTFQPSGGAGAGTPARLVATQDGPLSSRSVAVIAV